MTGPTKVVDIGSLDPMAFRIPASDTKGHSHREYFRVQPGHAQMVSEVLNSKKFPFRTRGDVHRLGLARLFRWLETISPIASVTAEVDAIMEIMREEEFALDFEQVYAKMAEMINMHMGRGAVGEARRLLLAVQRHINKMPDGYWRDRYIREMTTRFGHIIEEAPKASLRNFQKEEG